MVDKIGKSEIDNLRFQIGHAVLQRSAIDELLGNEDVLGEVERGCRNLITDLSGHRECAEPGKAVGQIPKTLAEIERRGEEAIVGGKTRSGRAGVSPIDDEAGEDRQLVLAV